MKIWSRQRAKFPWRGKMRWKQFRVSQEIRRSEETNSICLMHYSFHFYLCRKSLFGRKYIYIFIFFRCQVWFPASAEKIGPVNRISGGERPPFTRLRARAVRLNRAERTGDRRDGDAKLDSWPADGAWPEARDASPEPCVTLLPGKSLRERTTEEKSWEMFELLCFWGSVVFPSLRSESEDRLK